LAQELAAFQIERLAERPEGFHCLFQLFAFLAQRFRLAWKA
jgi:hypothetical protein